MNPELNDKTKNKTTVGNEKPNITNVRNSRNNNTKIEYSPYKRNNLINRLCTKLGLTHPSTAETIE